MDIKADIIDYMGKYSGGVIVLLSIECGGSFTEGTIYYSDKDIILTVDESVEDSIGGTVYDWPGYRALLESILSKLVPYEEISGRIDDVDFDKYIAKPEKSVFISDEVDPVSILVATQSNLV